MEITNTILVISTILFFLTTLTMFALWLKLRNNTKTLHKKTIIASAESVTNKVKVLKVTERSIDIAQYNTELLKLFGKIFDGAAEIFAVNNDMAQAGSLIEVVYKPGNEDLVLEALSSPEVFKEYVEYSDHGRASLCLIPYSALQKWTTELIRLNKKHTATFNTDLVKTTKNFSSILNRRPEDDPIKE